MSITPQFLDQLRDRVQISDVVGRYVTWDQKKSRPAQGDYWAPCPFHSEKTASFHADDQKGFYYCFGCHQKGDAIKFLRDKGNLEFVEAVRELCDMAGMEMPHADPHAKDRANEHGRMIDMHENAARYFALQLQTAAGAQARDYLQKNRGLSNKTIQQFGIGYIPNGRDLLLNHLREAGFKDDEIIDAGLALKPDDGGANFDRFRNRIMFPIHDARGRVIAFGGRAMDEKARAKYLNSADSKIFHKGRVVYNLLQARNAMQSDTHIVIVEGYMDVIALAQAGIRTAVAPMGTAITTDQLESIWRVDKMPVLALDGDAAGQRAAKRAAHLALPAISPERSLRFAMLPAGQDPDDLVKSKGVKAIQKLLNDAKPMVDLIWQDAMGDAPLDTPEARAAFDSRLKAIAGQISDPGLRAHYLAEFRDRRKDIWSKPKRSGKFWQRGGKTSATATAKLPEIPLKAHEDLRVALILRTILTYPELGKRLTDDLSNLSCPNQEIDRLRKEVVMAYGDLSALELLANEENLNKLSYGNLLKFMRIFEEGSTYDKAMDVSTDEINRATTHARAKAEIDQIMRETEQDSLTEEREALLNNAVLMRDEARKILDDQMDDDHDKRAFLRQFLESERWRK